MSGRRRGPSEATILRFLLFAGVVAVAGGDAFGVDALRESVASLRAGHAAPVAPVLAGGVLVVGGALAVRAGWSRFGDDGPEVETAIPDEKRPCRICGHELDPARSRCPRCDTRDPVPDE